MSCATGINAAVLDFGCALQKKRPGVSRKVASCSKNVIRGQTITSLTTYNLELINLIFYCTGWSIYNDTKHDILTTKCYFEIEWILLILVRKLSFTQSVFLFKSHMSYEVKTIYYGPRTWFWCHYIMTTLYKTSRCKNHQ